MATIANQQITVSVPSTDMDIFKKFSWKIAISKPQAEAEKTSFQKSQDDIKAGRINTYKNSDELFNAI